MSEEKDEFKCQICGETYDSKRGLHVHQSRSHRKNDEESEDDEGSGERGVFLDIRQVAAASALTGLILGALLTSLAYSSGMLGPSIAAANSTGPQKSIAKQIGIEDEPALGPDDAPVKIIEISDYGCPYCAEWYGVNAIPRQGYTVDRDDSFQKIKRNYIDPGKVQFIYKDYPAHPNSPLAHQAANCARKQKESYYWDFNSQLYKRRDSWMQSGQNQPYSTFRSIANDVGANSTALVQCVKTTDFTELRNDYQSIKNALPKAGTPTFLIGNEETGYTKISGAQPYSRIKSVIESKLSES